MSTKTTDSADPGADAQRTVVAARDPCTTAPGRCLLYALFSDVAASPFDTEAAVARDSLELAALDLPYELSNLAELIKEWRAIPAEELKREYSGLFEVGSDGPPVPIREDLHLNQPAGVREDIVRFYEFFGYGLEQNFAWAPDHLSVELEFMHMLCFQEAEAAEAEGDAVSFQLAQSDFAERHLCNWVSDLAVRIIEQRPESIYARLIPALSEFLVKDFDWQQSTIQTA